MYGPSIAAGNKRSKSKSKSKSPEPSHHGDGKKNVTKTGADNVDQVAHGGGGDRSSLSRDSSKEGSPVKTVSEVKNQNSTSEVKNQNSAKVKKENSVPREVKEKVEPEASEDSPDRTVKPDTGSGNPFEDTEEEVETADDVWVQRPDKLADTDRYTMGRGYR